MPKLRATLSLLFLVFALGLAACGSDPDVVDQESSNLESENPSSGESDQASTEDDPANEEVADEEAADEQGAIIESGFGQRDEYVFATTLVENTSDRGGQTVTVNFNVKDAGGQVVASETQVESFSSPGQRIAVGTQIGLDPGVTAASVDATLLVEDNGTFPESDLTFEPVEAEVFEDEYGGASARFMVTNPTNDPLQDLRIGIICKDDAGKIVGGGSEFPDLVPPSGEILVESSYLLTAGLPASCSAYINPAGF